MNRQPLFIKEKKERIERIKSKYPTLNDKEVSKIDKLNITNKALKVACSVVGITTVIDIFIPDPVFGLDEIALAGLTSLLKSCSNLTDKKIERIVKSEEPSLDKEEVLNLVKQLMSVIENVKSKKNREVML